MEDKVSIEIGDVILVANGGYGLEADNEGLYVEVLEFNHKGYYGDAGYRVGPYDNPLINHNQGEDWVTVDTFGATPLILLNTKEGVTKGDFHSPLETRKNDKNQMELVDTGFPNALMVLGEVMTWAAKNKGYRPNDWKDIPNPSMSLLGAASRHRNKRLKGEELDDESGLPHLAHEAFNVLAQLELLMIGKLK